MRYRLIECNDEKVVVMEDGGIACIRSTEELNDGDGRKSTTDYYFARLTEDMLSDENIDDVWEILGEGDMSWNDWTTEFNDPAHLKDALEWLCVGDHEFIRDDTLWEKFEG